MECVVCDEHIDQFKYNWLADMIPGCCLECAEVVHERRQQAFRDHLERASRIVESWPEWKRNILTAAVSHE